MTVNVCQPELAQGGFEVTGGSLGQGAAVAVTVGQGAAVAVT